jgi:hypothetical protein
VSFSSDAAAAAPFRSGFANPSGLPIGHPPPGLDREVRDRGGSTLADPGVVQHLIDTHRDMQVA